MKRKLKKWKIKIIGKQKTKKNITETEKQQTT